MANTLIVLGDSIAGASTTYSSSTEALGMTWPNQVNVLSRQQIRYLFNAGVFGNTCAQALARNATDVLARTPSVAALECGTNDVGNSVPLATTESNITTIIRTWLGAGIQPVLCTIPPRSDNDAFITPIVALNAWIRSFARANAIILVDFYAILVDPSNAHYRAGYSSDGIHPSNTIATSMANFFISKTTALFPSWTPFISQSASDTFNLITNSMFLSGGAAPTGWSFSGNNCAHAVVANATPPGGNWFQMTCTNLGVDQILFNCGSAAGTCTGGYTTGDRMAFSGTIDTSGVTSGSLIFTVQLDNQGAPFFVSVPMNNWTIDTTGTFYIEFVVGAGTTNLRPKLAITSGTGVIRIGQWALVNLTANGLI